MELPKLTQQPILHIDGTPDPEYPLRILEAYRKDCDCMWSESTGEEPMNPLLLIMNEQNSQRAKILDRAIKVLRANMSKG